MGCDVHLTCELRVQKTREDLIAEADVAVGLLRERIEKNEGVIAEREAEQKAIEPPFTGVDYARHHRAENARLRGDVKALEATIAGLERLPEGTTAAAWEPAGRIFESDRDSKSVHAARTELEALDDGALLDALAWNTREAEQPSERHRGGLTEGPLRARLDDGQRRILDAYRSRELADSEQGARVYEEWRATIAAWNEEHPVEAKRNDGYVSDEHPCAHRKLVAPRLREIVAERRRAVSLDPQMRESLIALVDGWDPYDDEDDDEPAYLGTIDRSADDPPFRTAEVYSGRNYDLFAVLADVRNGSGFAGVKTGDRIEPIADPRGVPADAHPETIRFMESFGVDGHSHTHHTLAQLLAYDYDQGHTHWGVVPGEDYDAMKELPPGSPPPGEVSGGISGAGIVTFSIEGYEDWKRAGRPDIGQQADRSFSRAADAPPGALVLERPYHAGETKPYVRVSWKTSLRESLGPAWFAALDRLREAAPGGDPEAIRLCAFWDN